MKKLRSKLFSYIQSIINEERKGILAFFIKGFLYFVSLCFSFLVFLKNFFYDTNILKQKKISSCVISIGNIVAGGVGKTPFTIFLAQKLKSNKLAILSRGYLSKKENDNLLVKDETSQEIGDEPYLIKKRLKEILLFVGKDRVKSALKAQNLGCDVIILDDGFQNRKLLKDIEIVILNNNDLFGKDHYLPRGYLRESVKSLKRADYIIVNNSKDISSFEEAKRKIRIYSVAPIIAMRPEVKSFYDLKENELHILPNTKVVCFCGIANPMNFKTILEERGLEIIDSLFLQDHEKISTQQLKQLLDKAKDKEAKYIICTEKDIVKLQKDFQFDIPIIYLKIDLKVMDNSCEIQSLVEKIFQIVNNE